MKHPRHDNHLWNVTLLRCSVLWCCRSSIPLSTYIAYLCFRQAKWMCTSQPTGCKLPFRPRLFSAHFTVSIISLPPSLALLPLPLSHPDSLPEEKSLIRHPQNSLAYLFCAFALKGEGVRRGLFRQGKTQSIRLTSALSLNAEGLLTLTLWGMLPQLKSDLGIPVCDLGVQR